MRRWRALAIVPMAALLFAGPVMAQDGSPTPDEGVENPRLVAPEECVAEPRAYEEIAGILALDGEGIPQPPYMQITPPLGDIVDLETDVQIKELTRHILACFNAGDIPGAASLMTDDGVQRAYWGITIDQENRELARQRLQAAPEERASEFLIRLITVTDASVLPDGRIAAFVVINEPLLPPAGPETLLFIYENVDGQWKLDDFIDFSIVPPDFGQESTPAA